MKSAGRVSMASRAGRGPMSASGRQLLPASCAASGEHPTAPGGLHPGAEAVLLGAMALLRLVGLLHRVSWSSTVRPQGFRSFRPQKARKRAARTEARGASTPGDYRKVPFGVSNEGCREALRRGPDATAAGRPSYTPWEYRGLGAGLPCGAGPGGATMRRPTVAGTPAGNPGRTPGPPRSARPACWETLHLSIELVRVRFAVPGTGRRASPPGRAPGSSRSVRWIHDTSGARPSGSSRSPSRRPTSRRGCGTPRWSRWTTPGSGSPSRTGSRRTGSRRAIAR